MLPRTGDGEALFVKELLDAEHILHIHAGVHALPGRAFGWFELGKFRLPETEHVARQSAQTSHFADAEVEFVGNHNFTRSGFSRSFLVRLWHGPQDQVAKRMLRRLA